MSTPPRNPPATHLTRALQGRRGRARSARNTRIPGWLALVGLIVAQAAQAADLAGRWSTGASGYVFSFARVDGAYEGSVTQTSSSRVFKIADIEVDGENVSFFVVHDADWDEEVQQNGGRAFRNWAEGTLSENELSIHGAREGSNERAYEVVLTRLPE